MENKGENTPDERLFFFQSVITPSKGRKRHRGQISKKTNKGLSPPAADTTQFFSYYYFFDGRNVPTVFFFVRFGEETNHQHGGKPVGKSFLFLRGIYLINKRNKAKKKMYQSEKKTIVQQNEKEAFAELEKIIANTGWVATATPPLTHYDATLTAPDGKRKIFVELKKRNGVKWNTYTSAIGLKIGKARELEKIQSETGVKVYVLIIYEENKYLAVSLDDLLEENNVQMHRMKKNEWEKGGETDFFKCFDVTIAENDIKKYN